MSYKISGTLSDAARVIVIKESDWSIESNTNESAGSYDVAGVENNAKLVIARKSDGEVLAFGDVDPIVFVSGDVADFATYAFPNSYLQWIAISTLGDGTDFGDMFSGRYWLGSTSNGLNDRGIWAGGDNGFATQIDVIDYVTIDNKSGNSVDFGDLTFQRYGVSCNSNRTGNRGLTNGGHLNAAGGRVNRIDYITISTLGDAIDFGDLTVKRRRTGSAANATRGVTAGGNASSGNVDTIDYVTISTTGDATDFGNLAAARNYLSGLDNHTGDRACFVGGPEAGSTNRIDYITISSTGNASDFGDLDVTTYSASTTSNGSNNRGLIRKRQNAGATDYITISTTGDSTAFGTLSYNSDAQMAACANA